MGKEQGCSFSLPPLSHPRGRVVGGKTVGLWKKISYLLQGVGWAREGDGQDGDGNQESLSHPLYIMLLLLQASSSGSTEGTSHCLGQ